jgi:nitroreductase
MRTLTTTRGDDLRGLGSNERAILERIRWAPARRWAARLVRAKMRMQFTGWLQYLVPVPAIVSFAVVGAVSWLLDATWPTTVSFAAAGALLAAVAFDIVTVKWKIHLPEARPPRNDHLDTFDLLRARRSCRSFQTRHMSDTDRAELLASVQTNLAVPTLGEATLRLEYVAAPLVVWPTVNASEFLVAIVPKEYDRTAVIDVGRTLQRVVVDATRMGLGTCWIGPGADHASVIAHLGDRFDALEDHIVCVCAVGYRSHFIPLFVRLFNRRMRHRLPRTALFFSDCELQHPIDTDAPPYDRFGRAFEACQWAPSSYNGQTTRAVVTTGSDSDVSDVRFLTTTASRYYAPVAVGIWCANWELSCDALSIEGDFVVASPDDPEHLPRHDVTWIRRADRPR